MNSLESLFILLFASILLVGVAQKFRVPYPLLLILGGIAIGFIPGIPPFDFDPNIILVIVLPPILYYAAFGISFREFRQNWRDIFSLALGLVVATTFLVAVIFKMLFPEFPWALAFAFGAIISPPDAISTTTILKRFSITSRLVTLLEGESLVNDASALVLYKLAVVALLSGTFSWMDAELHFFQAVGGGIILGFILGAGFQFFSRRYLEPVLGVVFSFTIPYITYILAGYVGVSGVLAVVVNGLIGSRILLLHHSSLRRVLGYAAWDTFTILLNCFVFILIGLQLRTIVSVFSLNQMMVYTGYAFLITCAMVLIRWIWVFAKSGISYLMTDKKTRSPEILKEAVLISWSGMRGIVSLAAASALPFIHYDGTPIYGRNEIIFITFVVIMLTLLIPGLTLPTLVRWLNLKHELEYRDTGKIRALLAKTVEEKLHHLRTSLIISKIEFDFLKAYFLTQTRVQEISHTTEYKIHNIEKARIKVIQAQRKKLLELWKVNEIDDKLFNQLENELDMVEVTTARAHLK